MAKVKARETDPVTRERLMAARLLLMGMESPMAYARAAVSDAGAAHQDIKAEIDGLMSSVNSTVLKLVDRLAVD